MKKRIDVKGPSSRAWIEAVLADFDSFLKDHADCERKASAMAMSFVAKFPDRVEIIPDLIDTAVEELEHFRDVYALMKDKGLELNHEIGKDLYVTNLIKLCRSGREERFLDRLLVASIVECRGAERFRMVYENLDEGEYKSFYHQLWVSEAKHGELFVKLALKYFDEKEVYERLAFFIEKEMDILNNLEIKAALH
jgi:tRNA 2-(methylsulfanyl)-N6-isopentenyladenosine37 hydroxylase